MRVLMIVQELNEASWVRGFIVAWVRALAAKVQTLHVLALEAYPTPLPTNVRVYSMGKERGKQRLRELLNFYCHVGRNIGRVDVILSHMTPRYTLLAAPLAVLWGVPQALWFIHPKPNAEIRAALACTRWVFTAMPATFPVPSPKVHALGHGLDSALFCPDPAATLADPPLILAVGRLTPIKNHHILLQAAAHLRDQHSLRARFAIVGGSAAGGDEAYRLSLLAQREALGLSASEFDLLGGLTTPEVLALTRRASLVTNLTPLGSFDKAALEGMLCGVPLVTANPAFVDLLGEHAPHLRLASPTDPIALAERLAHLLRMDAEARRRIGADLRARTAAQHGLEGLMDKMTALMQT
jgi:glycosyltransferase involved in cell wall biosynthesis